MAERIHCPDEDCSECRGIVVRVYDGLRRSGCSDKAAFLSALHVLKLRHPGHDARYYQDRASAWIDAD